MSVAGPLHQPPLTVALALGRNLLKGLSWKIWPPKALIVHLALRYEALAWVIYQRKNYPSVPFAAVFFFKVKDNLKKLFNFLSL